MAATVFYLDELPAVGEIATLDGPEGHHAATVRRTRVGERVLLCDRRGGVAESVVEAVARGVLRLAVSSRAHIPPSVPRVTVVQALPKSERGELAVELATEAGAHRIVAWQAARSVARWGAADKAARGVEKWRGAALSAARQSRRAYVPDVADRAFLADVVGLVRDAVARGAVVAMLHEAAMAKFTDLPLSAAPEVVLIVGPEGGIDDRERDALVEAGAHPVLLGPTVLRTSTAAAVALGALGAVTSLWAGAPPTWDCRDRSVGASLTPLIQHNGGGIGASTGGP